VSEVPPEQLRSSPLDPDAAEGLAPQQSRAFAGFTRAAGHHMPKRMSELRRLGLSMRALTSNAKRRR
jgi:hypothetical protein